MKIVDDAWRASELPRGGVGTIGNYDGVHRGQRAVLDRVCERGAVLAAPSLVITFEPHPVRILNPAGAPPRLTTREQKAKLLAATGIDYLLELRFDHQLAATPAADFVDRFLIDRLGLAEIYVGQSFVFGRRREGDLALLRRLAGARGCRVEGVAEVVEGGERVSSTRIRGALADGDVELAARLLGRPYAVAGRVVRGAGKGVQLGWPTINLEIDNELYPAVGVYVAVARLAGSGEALPAVANVGRRPTLHDDGERLIEAHLLDVDRDLYGAEAEIGFRHRLRGERRFPSLAALREQIGRDVEAARVYFAAGTSLVG